jgi:hypothetical protein
MDQQTFLITFDGISPVLAQRYSEELRNALLKATPDIEVQRGREDPYAQDFGTMLVLILQTPAVAAAAPAVVVAAKAMGDWLTRRPGTTVTIKAEGMEFSATGKDAPKLGERFLEFLEKQKP